MSLTSGSSVTPFHKVVQMHILEEGYRLLTLKRGLPQ